MIGLQSIIHSVNEWFAHLPPSIPARTYSSRPVPPLDLTPNRAWGRGSGIPTSSPRYAAVDLTSLLSEWFRQSLLNPWRRTERVPYDTTDLQSVILFVTSIYSPPPFRNDGSRPRHSELGTFHAMPGQPFAFHRNPTKPRNHRSNPALQWAELTAKLHPSSV